MRTDHSLNGGLRFYVSVIPALFPALVFLSISTAPISIRVNSRQMQGSPIIERVRDIYTSQIGVREKPSNTGLEVEKYLKYVYLPKGNPWCAAFVCWVLGDAGVSNPRSGWSPDLFGEGRVIWRKGEQGTKSKEQRLPTYVPGGFPSSLATGNWTRARNKEQRARSTIPRIFPISPTTNNQQPTTSDVFGIYFPEKARIAHVGFIDVWDGSWLITVEGNTNTSGGREGDGVYRKRRPVGSIYRVARYIN